METYGVCIYDTLMELLLEDDFDGPSLSFVEKAMAPPCTGIPHAYTHPSSVATANASSKVRNDNCQGPKTILYVDPVGGPPQGQPLAWLTLWRPLHRVHVF